MSENAEATNAVIAATSDVDGKKKLACAKAFQLAKALGVGVLEIGHICNANDIKICSCQLGCFK